MSLGSYIHAHTRLRLPAPVMLDLMYKGHTFRCMLAVRMTVLHLLECATRANIAAEDPVDRVDRRAS